MKFVLTVSQDCQSHIWMLNQRQKTVWRKSDDKNLLWSPLLVLYRQIQITMESLCETVIRASVIFLSQITISTEHNASEDKDTQSRSSLPFMEPEGSLPCSQKPPPVPILSQMNPVHIFKRILYNAFLACASISHNCLLSYSFPD
jgi:hypothetical protein